MSLLEVVNLDAGYGTLQVLHGVDLDVGDGEYVAIVGPNGAGKSTAVKAIVGLATYMDGRIAFDGADLTKLDPQEIIERGVGYVPQTANVFPSLTVEENLLIGGYRIGGLSEDRREAVFSQFPALEGRVDDRAGNLSGGQQQMLAIARALIPDPPLLILDEPSAGLAPNLVDDMFDHIDAINDRGVSIMVVEQNAKTALSRCDRGYVLAEGQNKYIDEGGVLLNDPDVRRQFLGG